MNKVVIYTTEFCSYCTAAKRLLKSKNIAYQEIDITDQDEMWDALDKKSGGHRTMPQIYVGEEFIGGYAELVRYFSSGKSL